MADSEAELLIHDVENVDNFLIDDEPYHLCNGCPFADEVHHKCLFNDETDYEFKSICNCSNENE